MQCADAIEVAVNQIDGLQGRELVEEFAETGGLWERLLSPRVASKGQVGHGVQNQRGKALEAKVRGGRCQLTVSEHTPKVLVFDGDAQFPIPTGELDVA